MASRTPQCRVILWSSPRCVSTAFARSIVTLEESEVFNENFAAAYYMGPERVERFQKGLNLAYDHTYEYVKAMLEKDVPGKEVVFVKDFAFALQGKYDKIPEGYIHTFLIRNPTKVFMSLRQMYDTCFRRIVHGTTIYECQPECHVFFEEMWKVYRHTKDVLKRPTIVMDADDLLSDPEAMMKSYCQITGIPFKRSMLSWKPCGARHMDWKSSNALQFFAWWMGWNENALDSSGFGKTQTKMRIIPDELPADIKEAVEISEQYYKLMYEERLQI